MSLIRLSNKLLQLIFAILVAGIIASIHLFFVTNFCINVTETAMPSGQDIFIPAKFSVIFPITLLAIISCLIGFLSFRKYKLFLFIYLSLMIFLVGYTLLGIDTQYISGI